MNMSQEKMLKAISIDIGHNARPFLNIAKKLNTSEEEVICRIKRLLKEKIIRRFSAIVNHNKLGVRANCLCAWQVAKKDLSKTGKVFAGFKQVSHCYARKSYKHWPYNLYTMVHATSKKELNETIKKMAKIGNILSYISLRTLKEFKKQAIGML